MSLKIFYWNCGSGLLRKLDFIKYVILENHLDAFFISEAEVASNFDTGCLSVTGYDTIFSQTLMSRGKTRLICFKKCELVTLSIGSEFDDVICLSYGGKTIVGLYRGFKCFDQETEKSNFDRLLATLSELNFNSETFIIGDFNIDVSKKSSRFLNELIEWNDSKGLNILDSGTSRARWVDNNLQQSTIDFVLSNTNKLNLSKEFTHLSDHFIIKMNILTFLPIVRNKTWVTLKNWQFDIDKAIGFLSPLLESSLIMSLENVNEIDYRIRACLIRTQKHFVLSRKTCLNNPSQVTSIKIVKIKNWRNKLRKRWLNDRSAINWVNLVRASRLLKKEVARVRRKKIKSNLSKGSKEFWNEIKKLQGVTNDEIGKLVVNGTEVVMKDKIADLFVEFFTNKVNNLLGNYSPEPIVIIADDFQHFTIAEVKLAIDRLTNKKSAGLDGISGFFVKKFNNTLAPYLAFLFNKMISSNSVPELWKIAKIIPVHKKGPKTELSNFRPVSNLLSIAKIYELCLLSRMEKFDPDLLHGLSQHGFRKEHSTTTAVVEIVDFICNERDNKNVVGMYSVDLTAAFDLLTKERLIHVLQKKNFPNYLISSIYNYLSSRAGYVQIQDSISCLREIKAGCIQGSILGPILYNIFTSELETIIFPSKLVVYADDAYVIASCDTKEKLCDLLKLTISRHFEWLEEMGMICNLAKTELLMFGVENAEIVISDTKIASKDTMKVLGILIDNKITWDQQINKVISSCRSKMFGMRYLRQNLSIQDTFTIFRSHLISKLTYCSPAWTANLSYHQMNKLRSFYYHSIRVLLRDFDLRLNRKKLLEASGMQSLDTIFFMRTSVFLFNIVRSLNPSRLACSLLSRAYHNERQPGKLVFFDISTSKIGKKTVLNQSKNICERWQFDWVDLSTATFKHNLKEQFG